VAAGRALSRRDSGPALNATRCPEVLGGLGGFVGSAALPSGLEQTPLLVAGTMEWAPTGTGSGPLPHHWTLGIDLVAIRA